MSRLGTCRHCWQIQEMYIVPLHPQPHEAAETKIDQPEAYECGWEPAEGMPPPLRRKAGGLFLKDDDCDKCSFYEPVRVTIPGLRKD